MERPGGVCRVDRSRGATTSGCESCHGPGSLHAEHPRADNVAGRPAEAVCVACHNHGELARLRLRRVRAADPRPGARRLALSRSPRGRKGPAGRLFDRAENRRIPSPSPRPRPRECSSPSSASSRDRRASGGPEGARAARRARGRCLPGRQRRGRGEDTPDDPEVSKQVEQESEELEELRALEDVTVAPEADPDADVLQCACGGWGWRTRCGSGCWTRSDDAELREDAAPAELPRITDLASFDVARCSRTSYDIPVEMQPLVAQYIQLLPGTGAQVVPQVDVPLRRATSR